MRRIRLDIASLLFVVLVRPSARSSKGFVVAETWQACLQQLSDGRLLGRFFAASREPLREVAERLGFAPGGQPRRLRGDLAVARSPRRGVFRNAPGSSSALIGRTHALDPCVSELNGSSRSKR
jgi:hypothetical protein